MSTIITQQIVRDYLVFNGPSTVSELVKVMKDRSGMTVEPVIVLYALKALERKGSAAFDNDRGIYTAKVEL
jgi:hypothetical protein